MDALTPNGPREPLAYVYRHIVTFDETNVMGNVYYVRHIAWQGRCRELFLKEHVPGVLGELAAGLRLVTISVSCEYFAEVQALDEIEVHMRLAFVRQHRLGLNFDYFRTDINGPTPIAKGFQQLGCMRILGAGLTPTEPPEHLSSALTPYRVA